MIVTIHQPEYLPWIGFFDRIYKADTFVILDDVQYQKNAFINRNKIKTAQGWQWITVPVLERGSLKKINEVKINNQIQWGKDIWKALLYNYTKTPFFKNYADFFKNAFERKWELIADLDVYLLENMVDMIGMKRRIERSSLMKVKGKATDKLVNICKTLGADTYLSGPGGREYMDLEKFKKEGIKVIFQDFTHPEYPQQFEKEGFISHLSIVDLLFNCGKKSLEVIKKGGNL
jgi:hypothetical protein